MKLLKEDEALVSRITKMLETQQTAKTLSLGDVSLSGVQRLLASETPDLAMFGSYVLSMLPDNLDLTVVKENLASARNYARFLIAEKSLPSARNIVMNEAAKHPFLLRHFGELSARIAQPENQKINYHGNAYSSGVLTRSPEYWDAV